MGSASLGAGGTCLLLLQVFLGATFTPGWGAARTNTELVAGKSGHCGIWTQSSLGGAFTSPGYPSAYPPNQACSYPLEAPVNHRVRLIISKISIETSWGCKYDHVEVKDGPFALSPLLGRYCGSVPPRPLVSSGRFLWVGFKSDEELQEGGFQARYSFITDPNFPNAPAGLPECKFETGGADGEVTSKQAELERKATPGQPLDCSWTIRATPGAQLYLRFLDYRLEYSNDCRLNFVAIYDGGSGSTDLRTKFCSTVASEMTLGSGLAAVRFWTTSHNADFSYFRLLFTSFFQPPCDSASFFCHSSMCINHSLVCNGVQNCAYPWDEAHCTEVEPPTVWQRLGGTNGSIIGACSAVVLLLLSLSVYIQLTQPRRKILSCPISDTSPLTLAPSSSFPTLTLEQETYIDLSDIPDDFEPFLCLRHDPMTASPLHPTSTLCPMSHQCGGPTLAGAGGTRFDLGADEVPRSSHERKESQSQDTVPHASTAGFQLLQPTFLSLPQHESSQTPIAPPELISASATLPPPPPGRSGSGKRRFYTFKPSPMRKTREGAAGRVSPGEASSGQENETAGELGRTLKRAISVEV
uniref:Neuropilin and tolloid like 2 n=1 Tax=Eptatretus burgeri TaxID=7764 RepID=A0A8C4Q174_EPTBU